MEKSVIIVAGGAGIRMGGNIPKQFILLNGLPILMHSIKRFHEYDSNVRIIVVLPAAETDRWKSLINKYKFSVPHKVVYGGQSRFESVQNGLKEVHSGIVAIHDGVRPLISTKLIGHCFLEAESYSNAIPSIPVTDTIRMANEVENIMIDRALLKRIQTPQCFEVEMLKKAYEAAPNQDYTDDAGVFESIGNMIHLVEGEKLNIKITDPDDLVVAEAIMAQMFR
jgi:2-C-methyl-D-erythritol 4-phosphate cytidylyltransferase